MAATQRAHASFRRPTSPSRRSRTAGAVCGALLLLTGCGDVLGGLVPGGAAGGNPNGEPSTSEEVGAMQAIGQLVVTNDQVFAQLNVLTTAGSEVRALSGVASPFVDVAGEQRNLPTTDFVGVFETSASLPSDLAPAGGDVVTFGYEITDTDGDVTAVEVETTAPAEAPVLTFPQTLIYFTLEPLELELSGWADGGWIQVANASGELTHTTIDTELSATPALLASIEAMQPPTYTIPGSAFEEPGVYTILVATFALADAEQVAAQLGAWSWFGVGRTSSYEVAIEL